MIFQTIDEVGVHIGRNSAGHVSYNNFDNCNIDIQATQSSRLRTINNNHKNWRSHGVNVHLNATWEGIDEESFDENSITQDTPPYYIFYGSTIPVVSLGSHLSRNTSTIFSPLLDSDNNDSIQFITHRVNTLFFNVKTYQINIKIPCVIYGNTSITFNFLNGDKTYGEFTINNNSQYIARGNIEINIFPSSNGAIINYEYPNLSGIFCNG